MYINLTSYNKYKPRKKKRTTGNELKKYTPKSFERYVPQATPYRRETKEYPSVMSTQHNTTKVEPLRYTGTLVKGISTMHKSNAVPILDEKEAKEHANMRR